MADAEDVLLTAAERATSALRRRGSRHRARDEGGPESSRALLRLERWLVACFGRSWPIALCDRPVPVGWLRRSFTRPAPWQIAPMPVAATDGALLLLPREAIETEWVRLAALALGRRLLRGECSGPATSGPGRDACWAIVAARGDAALAELLPGLAASLASARERALTARPALEALRDSERAVEALVRTLLVDPRRALERDVSEWIGQSDPDYRGVAPVAHWGAFRAPDPVGSVPIPSPGQRDANPPPAHRSRRLSRPLRRRRSQEAARRSGPFIAHSESHLSVQDPCGLERPDDRGDEDLDALADEISRLDELPTLRSDRPVREVLESSTAPGDVAENGEPTSAGVDALRYPEWDWRRAAYRDPGIVLREARVPDGDPEWATRVLQRRAPLLASLRRQFLALRPRLDRMPRQIDGDEIDVDGWIVEYADRVSGGSPRGQHYCLTRRRRRDVAVALLVDASGSTDSWISRDERVIDVAKEGALVLSEALSAVGDRHAIYSFSGHGPGDVRVGVAKRFSESLDRAVRSRIGALQPDRSTRLGGPIRHVTAALAGVAAQTRILLVLSDGKPNDIDVYEGDYGVEDVRQALCEARAAGVRSFCVTIDRRGTAYLPKLFGRSGYTLLWDASQLPRQFPQIYRHLTRGLSA